jgi:hypothetical protein
MERRTSRHQDIQADLQDVRLHLERKFPDRAPICLTIHRHYGSEADEIAYLIVEVDHQETRRRIRRAGEAALRQIGYRFAPRPGADVYDVMPYTDRLSAHETVRALARFRYLP